MRMGLRPWSLVWFSLMGMAFGHALLAIGVLAIQIEQYYAYLALRSSGRFRPGPVPGLWEWIELKWILWPYSYANSWGRSSSDVMLMILGPVQAGLLVPALCYLFSDTLRFERVRLLHLVRIEGLWLASSAMSGMIVVAAVGTTNSYSMGSWFDWLIFGVMGVVWVVWPFAFWWRAFELYLRMRRPLVMTVVLGRSAGVMSLALTALWLLLAGML
jgi:hypothetical protein